VGSPFTNALGIALANARRSNAAITPVQLREAVVAELTRLGIPTDLGPKGANPHVWGDPALLGKSLPVALPPGKIWAQLQQIAEESTPGAVSIHMANTRIAHGQPLQFDLDLARGGYVTVINANQKDDAEVLIPNEAVPELKLAAGHYVLPKLINRTWIADEPERVLVTVIVTPTKLDLRGGKSADALIDRLRGAMAGNGTARLYHDRTTEAAQPLASVSRPEAVSVESEIVP
jgi:hypothetical protein